MRTGIVSFLELDEAGKRLNGGYFLSEDEEAMRLLRRWNGRKVPICDLAKPNGVFTGGIFRIASVEDPSRGRPYVSAKDLVQSQITPTTFLSPSMGSLLSTLELREGMVLITCSGMNLGKAIWSRRDMEGLCASGDLIRIVPDTTKCFPGYMYAYLSSRFGWASIRKLIYGGHIKHIEPRAVSRIEVPRLPSKIEQAAHESVVKAARLREKATLAIQEALASVEEHLGVPTHPRNELTHNVVRISEIKRSMRLDAFFYNARASRVHKWANSHPNGRWQLSEIADVYDVPPFKHIYVDETNGVPFYTSGELFRLDRRPEKFLSRTQTKGLNKYVLGRGWVLLARSGQLGGIVCRPQFSDSSLDGSATSDHVIRIIAKGDGVPAGYIYAYLATSNVGYPLLSRTMSGSSVPALWPVFLETLPIVKAPHSLMVEIDRVIQKAFEMRVDANTCEDHARDLIEDTIKEGD